VRCAIYISTHRAARNGPNDEVAFGKHAWQERDPEAGGHQVKDEVSLTASGFEASNFFRSDISDIVDLASLKGFPVAVKTGTKYSQTQVEWTDRSRPDRARRG
jgi:hypothetical protein